jgi:asparagine synthetase B (glutamine-hydrolysing)
LPDAPEGSAITRSPQHAGIKPLAYTVVNGRLYVASEIKAFYAVREWRA